MIYGRKQGKVKIIILKMDQGKIVFEADNLPEIFRQPEDHLDFYLDGLALPASTMPFPNHILGF